MIQRKKKDIVKVGYIGLGRRGMSMLNHCFSKMADVELSWICDLREDRIANALTMFEEKGLPIPKTTTDYHEILRDPSVDAVLVMTGWDAHVKCSLDSMRAGKYTAVEVGVAYDLSECFELIRVYEETGSPLMMLENCCYGRREMMALRMVKEGLFGEILHCAGGYMHFLNEWELMICKDGRFDTDHYRLYEYHKRNCEQYPTHEFGPIAKVLGINRGNRVLSLSSFASKSRAISQYMKDYVSETHPLHDATFKQGDIVNTVLTCANGETVLLQLDTTAPRPFYSRGFTVRGTKGCCMEEGNVGTVFLEGMKEPVSGNEAEFFEKYDHPLHAEQTKYEALGPHEGGVDWIVGRAFIESVKAGTDTPIDAYDTATWMAIGPLSEASIAKGGMPVEFPDFTCGKWIRREPPIRGKYCLDEICEDPTTPIYPLREKNTSAK